MLLGTGFVPVEIHVHGPNNAKIQYMLKLYSSGGHVGQQMPLSGSAGNGLGHVDGDSQCTVPHITSRA